MDSYPFQLIQHISSSHHGAYPAKNSPLVSFPQIRNMIQVCYMNQAKYPFPSIERIPYRVKRPYSKRGGIDCARII